MKKLMLTLMLGVMMMASLVVVSADTLFEDDFDSYVDLGEYDANSDMQAAGWQADWFESSGYISPWYDVRIQNSDYQSSPNSVQLEDDVAIYHEVDTTGKENINFAYCRKTYSAYSSDRLKIGWKTGSASTSWGDWTELESIQEGWDCVDFDLPSSADDTTIQIAFFLDDGEDDNGRVDNVLVTGDVLDHDAPVITMDAEPIYPTCSSDITVCAIVTDVSAINFVDISCTAGSTTINHANVLGIGDQYCSDFSAGSMGPLDNMDFVCTVEAEDVHTNNAVSATTLATYDCEAPIVDFTCSPISGEEHLNVTCTSTSLDTVTPTNELVYAWIFGNGQTSTMANPNVVYNEDGIYTVSLTVTDNALNSDTLTLSDYITVLDTLPVTSFNANPNPVSEGLDVTFTDTTIITDPIGSWLWNFGDSQTSTEQNPIHAYGDNGEYVVSLTVCEATETSDCSIAIVNVTVVNVAPNVDAGQYLCNEAETISLTAEYTDVAGDGPWIVEWDFNGDGVYNDSFGETVSYLCGNGHGYVSGDVAVKVTDKDGDFGTDAAEINISNVVPVANANGPYSAAVNKQVCFDGSATDDWDTVFTYEWDLDNDGIFETSEQNPCTTYSSTGEYIVALKATDDYDTSEVATAIVTVHDYSIVLNADWNLFSIPLVPEEDDTSIDNVLGEEISSKAIVIWSYVYDADKDKNVWLYNEPIADGSRWWATSSRIQEIVPGYGYYIEMNDGSTLYQNGEKMYGQGVLSHPPVVQLTNGWNLIGHYGMNPSVAKADALTAFSGVASTLLNEKGAVVQNFNPTEGYWLFTTEINTGEYAPSEDSYNY